MPLTPGTRLGVYQITALLGEGGMGQVFRARDTKLDRDVAIKILPEAFAHDADRLARFTREAKTLASLNHPHIAAIYGLETGQVGREGQESPVGSFLVMELVEGDDLSQGIARGAIPLDEALPIAKQIAEALEAAHEQGIIHRDLKPANIKVRSDGTVKVLDFGLAKALAPAAGSEAAAALANSPTLTSPGVMTATGIILGTAAYMSPEQARGKTVDKRTDLWAFGVVLFEMLTGTRPFLGDDVTDIIAAIVRADPNWSALPSATPAPIRRLLRRCLEKDRLHRFADAADARLEIDDALRPSSTTEHLAIDATVPPDVAARSAWARALPWTVATILGAALVAALLSWAPWRSLPPVSVRLALSLSHDNSLIASGGTAISRDGRTVAFAASSPDGSLLYVRRLDEWEPRALPLTEGAGNPSFSPSGQWVAFSRGRSLEKIPVSGGPPQVICKCGAQQGRWLNEGTLLLDGWPDAGLWRVSAEGGAPQLIARPTEGSGVRYLWPEPLPRDRGLLFTIYREGRTSIAVLPPGAVTPRVLIESGGFPRYLPTGHLVYVAGGHLFAVGFDTEQLELRGVATVMVGEVNEDPLTSDFDVSANGVLVYRPTGSSTFNLVWTDRHGVATPLGTGSRQYESPALSPDGERLSVVVREGPSRNIWTGRVANEPLTRLTFGNDDWYGVWSRDGSRLFYLASQNGVYNNFSILTNGSGTSERLTRSPNPQNPTSASPRGDALLFNDIDPVTSGDVWELSLSSKEVRPILKTQFNEGQAVFSPDGQWIAYQSDESGRAEVYVQAYPGPGAKRRVSLEGGFSPSWSHTGRELFYRTSTAMFAVPILDAHDLRAGPPQLLFTKVRGQGTSRADPSLDDQRFLMLERPANESSQLNIVQDWFEELKATLPSK